MSKKDFINELNKKRSTFHDTDQAEMISNLLDTVSSDIYSESQRFIFELIQNADDAASGNENEMQFDFHSDCLIISHNGRTFDETDINAITHAGKGTKESDQTKTGYKGIGFKSVFGKSDKVHVFSDGYNFRFDRKFIKQSFNGVKMPWQIIPVWTDKNELPESSRTILSNGYNVCTVVELKNTNGLINDLNELLSNGKILLFLRRIIRISISVNGEYKFSIEKETIRKEKHFDEISILKNNTETSRWIVKTFENIPIDTEAQYELQQDEKTPDKLKKAKFTEISFAARIEKGRIKALKGEDSLIFTYLPTKVFDFEFPFLVNGNFLTNASREAIHEDRFWNQWLFKNIGIKIFDWLELLSSSKYENQILHLLPNRFNSVQNELKITFDKALIEAGKIKAFIPNENGTLRIASDILIDKTGLSEENFISKTALIEFINKVESKIFDNEAFIHPKVELKWKLNNLGAVTFDLENLEDFFIDDSFTSTHKPIDNFNLISFFFEKSNKSDSRELNEKLKSIPFIYAKGKKLKSPKTLCFPSVNYETEFGEGVSVIHAKVYPKIESEPKIKNWLESLGVKEPSDMAYIENEIIGNIEDAINESNFLDVTRYLFNQHKKGNLEERHYRSLQEIKLFTTNREFIPANQCYLSNIYEPVLKIEKIVENGKYVSDKYKYSGDLASEWKTFFIRIKVGENLSLIEDIDASNNVIPHAYKEFAVKSAKETNGYPHLIRYSNRLIISKITFSEYLSDKNFAKIFWKNVLLNINPNSISRYAEMPWGYYGSREYFENYPQWSFKNESIFPTTMKGNNLYASEVFINLPEFEEIAGKYLPVFACDIIPNEEWVKFIPFKQKFEVEDYLTILEKIAEETEKDDEIKKVNKKRIGLIYTQLSEKLKILSDKRKSELTEWSAENCLLSESGKYEKSEELKWIKIPKFSTSSESLKTIFIPDNCDTESKYFQELLTLFGVQIIDGFTPSFENPVPNASLKIQLQIILPYLVTLIEKRQFCNFSTEYERISNIVDKSEFFNASNINLSFKNQGELISGPALNAYLHDNQLYFKGKWTSPLTMYSLVPELLKLLNIKDLNDELYLILQLDENEIKEWFSEQGYELQVLQEKPEFTKSLEKVKSYTSEEDIEQSYDLVDNSDEKSRISISQDAKESIFEKLKQKGFSVPDTLEINYTIVKGIKNPNRLPIKLVVKSGKAGKLYFNPNEWLALTEPDTQLFVVTRGNIVRNVILDDLTAINDTFHMRFNTQAFAVNTNLKAFANFFRYLPYTHFIFDTPESTTDYLQQFGLNERNPSSKELSSDDKNLLH
ncbi:MAG: hypothetical protein PHW82_12105 [Bacteroidales bacterium]|nr:hypothetical protein [Bacteroidales bacterium]